MLNMYLHLIGNKGEVQVRDGKVDNKVGHNKSKKIKKNNSKSFRINITTVKDVSSMNQNNSICAASLKRFQEWKPGLCSKECWINDEVGFEEQMDSKNLCLIIWLYIHIDHVKVITLSNLKKKEIEEGKERGQVRDH